MARSGGGGGENYGWYVKQIKNFKKPSFEQKRKKQRSLCS